MLFYLHFYPCTAALMKVTAKLLSFIMLMGFLQSFIFKVEKNCRVSDFAVHFQIHCSQMAMLSLLFTDAAEISADSVCLRSVHVHGHTVYCIVYKHAEFIAFPFEHVHLLGNSACASVCPSACALIRANVCGFFCILGSVLFGY